MPTVPGVDQRLRCHDAAMHDARPDSEPDEAQVVERATRREQQKNTERRVNPQNHLQVSRGAARVPRPSRRPENG